MVLERPEYGGPVESEAGGAAIRSRVVKAPSVPYVRAVSGLASGLGSSVPSAASVRSALAGGVASSYACGAYS